MAGYNRFNNAPSNRSGGPSRETGTPFVNPYSFVPFGGELQKKDPARVYSDAAALKTGWLDVALYPTTPLIVPNGTPVATEGDHKTYAFYRLPDAQNSLAIPGSSLRGMLRSVYEAATNSCLPVLPNDTKSLSQRTPMKGAFKNRGLLLYDPQSGQWALYEANVVHRFMLSYSDLDEIYERGTYKGHAPGAYCTIGAYSGTLQFNLPIGYKEKTSQGADHRQLRVQSYAYLLAPTGKPMDSWNDRDKRDPNPYKLLQSALNRDNVTGNQGNPNKNCANLYQNAVDELSEKGGYLPVWYECIARDGRDLFYLSNSSVGRVGRVRRWPDILAGHTKCTSPDALCPACLLFGTLAGDGQRGRLRVSDALPEGDFSSQYHLLQILGGPRPTAFEFYLKRPAPDALIWNFDFYGKKPPQQERGFYSNGGEKKGLVYADAQPKPRGRKMYWHQSKPAPDAQDKTGQNATMEALTPNGDAHFRFKLYFDGITQTQLDELIWLISLGENRRDSTMQHKLGHAKPLGYGSVKLVVQGCHLSTVSRTAQGGVAMEMQTAAVPTTPPCPFDETSVAFRSLLRLCDTTSTAGKEVRYPVNIDRSGKPAIYAWFANNRQKLEKLQVLPEPTDANITLFDHQGDNPGGGYGPRSNAPRGNAPYGGPRSDAPRSNAPYGGPRGERPFAQKGGASKGFGSGTVETGTVSEIKPVYGQEVDRVLIRVDSREHPVNAFVNRPHDLKIHDRVTVSVGRFDEKYKNYRGYDVKKKG